MYMYPQDMKFLLADHDASDDNNDDTNNNDDDT